jgi:arylsulfatase A-like enzyme
MFTSDNGLLWGEHRWARKEVPYEEAIRVPLLIRADGLTSAEGRTDAHLVANIDLAPTIAAAAGLPLPDADGRSLLPLLEGRTEGWRQALLIEHLRGTNPIPTYCAIRTSRYLFVSYDTGERELYDLADDPFELANLAGSAPQTQARLEGVLDRFCDPPPPGFRRQMGPAAIVLAIAVVLAVAGATRSLVSRADRSRGVA